MCKLPGGHGPPPPGPEAQEAWLARGPWSQALAALQQDSATTWPLQTRLGILITVIKMPAFAVVMSAVPGLSVQSTSASSPPLAPNPLPCPSRAHSPLGLLVPGSHVLSWRGWVLGRTSPTPPPSLHPDHLGSQALRRGHGDWQKPFPTKGSLNGVQVTCLPCPSGLGTSAQGCSLQYPLPPAPPCWEPPAPCAASTQTPRGVGTPPWGHCPSTVWV